MASTELFTYDINDERTFFTEGPPTGKVIKERVKYLNANVQWEA